MSAKDYIEVLSIKALFEGDHYIIPLYQRNYAWGETQIEQLVLDVTDASEEYADRKLNMPDAEDKQYYLGSLVVFERQLGTKKLYETIDGQQRLTTLNILFSVLKNEYAAILTQLGLDQLQPILHFKSRETSTKSIKTLFNHGLKTNAESLNPQMKQAYEILRRSLDKKSVPELVDFINYLVNHVRILRIEVPEQTDLNHYFEVMNNRGEQLEKHEILKAKLLKELTYVDEGSEEISETSKKLRSTFNQIWEACSQMDKYVQYRITNTEVRKEIFGQDWDQLPVDFDQAMNVLKHSAEKDDSPSQTGYEKDSILDIIYRPKVEEPGEVDEEDENLMYFTPVVSFSNFLLHVLRINTGKDVQLDDKKLIQEFNTYILNVKEEPEQKIERVKDFCSTLLTCKFLFDQYIVKRVYKAGKDNWGLLRLQKRATGKNEAYYRGTFGDDEDVKGINQQLVMILAMFHVSFPQTIYKHWLTGALNYLFNKVKNEEEITSSEYLNYLEKMSDAFFFDRLAGKELKYYDIIFKNLLDSSPDHVINHDFTSDDVKTNLNQGTKVQNFIFNRLDYRLWLDFDSAKNQIESLDPEFSNPNPNKFEFSFRSSVEHYSPQTPMHGKKPISNIDDFGNLCLISASKNSEVSNYPFQRKREHYRDLKSIESLKQQLMMCYANWDEASVKDHQEKMIEVLKIKAN